jgi:D-alanyl-D-alanine carboxypeptidase
MKRLMLWVGVIAAAITVTAQGGVTEDDLLDILTEYTTESDTAIVVHLDDNGTGVTAAYGLADLASGTPATTDDLFRIGSITKPMVAVTVLALVDEGDVDLDVPIADYVPADVIADVENADVATVRQVLQMTSGIFSYTESDAFDDAVTANPTTAWTNADTVRFAAGEDAYFTPGEDFYYSNTNYTLAGVLIETVTGGTLADALEAYVFEPADMTTCYLETPERFGRDMVRGYSEGEDITLINDGVGLGDGGVVCTAQDLAKFPVALFEGDLISDDMLDEMLTGFENDEGAPYGLGIDVDEESDYGLWVGHGGSTSGFNAYMGYLPDEGLSIAVLTNSFDVEYQEEIPYDVFDLAFGE